MPTGLLVSSSLVESTASAKVVFSPQESPGLLPKAKPQACLAETEWSGVSFTRNLPRHITGHCCAPEGHHRSPRILGQGEEQGLVLPCQLGETWGGMWETKRKFAELSVSSFIRLFVRLFVCFSFSELPIPQKILS